MGIQDRDYYRDKKSVNFNYNPKEFRGQWDEPIKGEQNSSQNILSRINYKKILKTLQQQVTDGQKETARLNGEKKNLIQKIEELQDRNNTLSEKQTTGDLLLKEREEEIIVMKKLKLVTVVGTRPEIIRLAEIIKLADTNYNHILVHTGQNYDYALNEIFFEDLRLR